MSQGAFHFCRIASGSSCLHCCQPGVHSHALLHGSNLLGHVCEYCMDRACVDPAMLARQLRRTARQLSQAADLLDTRGLRVNRGDRGASSLAPIAASA